MKYYMVTDKDGCIWGIGLTKSEAQKDAKKELKLNPYDVVLSKAIECDEELYDYVFKNGSGEEDTWTIVKGIARLDKSIKKKKAENVLLRFGHINGLGSKLNVIYKKLLEIELKMEKSSFL